MLNVNFNKSIEIYNVNISNLMKICWIFDIKASYQVFISLGSIIKSNPNKNFIFYFIIPPNETIDLFKYNLLLPKQSKIYIEHFNYRQTYVPKRSTLKCIWDGIIAVKLHLKDILPNIDKILYLDTDVMNVAPLDQLWETNIDNFSIAGTRRPFNKKIHINSGVILYNLNFLRKQSRRIWNCANKKICSVDDYWHTNCLKYSRLEIPYRYNVEFSGMVMFSNVSEYQVSEESKAILYHLKDHYHVFYSGRDISAFNNFSSVLNNTKVLNKLKSLYDIMNWVINQVETKSKELIK